MVVTTFPAEVSISRSWFRILLTLSFFSGCAALVYEVVWFQMLQLVIGSSVVSLGVLLATYMGGMCLGSLILPRLISPRWNPLRVCALLEAGIGLMGLLILFVLPEAAVIYTAHADGDATGIFLRGVLAAACLLPPTILMGATLPVIARWVGSTRENISWLGVFYGCNIAGAVVGCLTAGFYLLRVHDSSIATFVAMALNGLIALLALMLSFFNRRGEEVQPKPATIVVPEIAAKTSVPKESLLPIYITIAISGATALGAEVIWTRLLSLTLGGTVYTFSIILAVFLIGIGSGSHFGAVIARRKIRPNLALGWCQLLLSAGIAWTAYMLAESLPYWPAPNPNANPWVSFQISLSHCLWALLPPTLLWGASFPLALAAAAERGRDPARLFGEVSAANTFGGILGAVGFSVTLIPLQGMQYGQRLLILLAAFSALLLLAPLALDWRRKFTCGAALRSALTVTMLIGLPMACARSISKIPGELLAFGRNVQWLGGKSELLFAGEGESYPVGVSQIWDSSIRIFHVSGKIEASTYVKDMRLQRMLGHLPALLHPKPQSVLVVGCGAGVTAGSFTLYPDVKRIVVCELEPLVPKIAAEYFSHQNYNLLEDYRTKVISDDARHYILTTDEKFDIITSDPIHPWVKGSANLYTKEYFDLVKAHLNRGGIVTQWVPLYQSNVEVVKSEIATFFEVFPNGTVWSSDLPGHGSDLVLLGQYGASQINLDEIQRKLGQLGYSRVTQSLSEIGFSSALDLFAGYSGQARDLSPWLCDAQINHDQNLRLQYLAGFTLDKQVNEWIYRDLIAFRKFPDNLFVGSPQITEQLAALMWRLPARHKPFGG